MPNDFEQIAKVLQSAHILVENVPGLQDRGRDVFNRFLNLIREAGYNVCFDVVNAKNYGVPQNRRRLILIASRLFQPVIPPITHGEGDGLLPYATVRNAIEHFPAIHAGGECATVPNHRAAELQQINLQRLAATPHDGGDRHLWPQNLILRCHANGGYTDVYGRMYWDQVSPTLTSKCYSLSNGRFGHPEQDRAISLREAASIQTFPDNYIFYGNLREIGRQIGNAVPVSLAQNLGAYILQEHNRIMHPQDA